MKNINWHNMIERALWTFFEGFLVALPATFSLKMDGAALKAVIIGAAMAGLSALKTLLIDIIRSIIDGKNIQNNESETDSIAIEDDKETY